MQENFDLIFCHNQLRAHNIKSINFIDLVERQFDEYLRTHDKFTGGDLIVQHEKKPLSGKCETIFLNHSKKLLSASLQN